MSKDFVAKATVAIDATKEVVWEALLSPEKIKQYMFGATVATDWKVGSPITWSGEWEGTSYQDKGKVLRVDPRRILRYSHYSPLSKKPDKPENYHTVTIALTDQGKQTVVSLEQDGNSTADARDHSQKNWEEMLKRLKKIVES